MESKKGFINQGDQPQDRMPFLYRRYLKHYKLKVKIKMFVNVF